ERQKTSDRRRATIDYDLPTSDVAPLSASVIQRSPNAKRGTRCRLRPAGPPPDVLRHSLFPLPPSLFPLRSRFDVRVGQIDHDQAFRADRKDLHQHVRRIARHGRARAEWTIDRILEL